MIDAPIALAFTAGMIAAFNPCGFAMLPAYLGYYAGTQRESGTPVQAVGRALRVSASVAAGFALVFGVAGLIIAQASSAILGVVPRLTIAIGLALIPLGIAIAFGLKLRVPLPLMKRASDGRGVGSMFAFGVSYGTVSLTCTLPPFLAAVSSTFRISGIVSGIMVFGAYALGMATVLTSLTIAIALARRGVLDRMRRVLPHVNRLAGALLAVAGAYVAYYGYFDLSITGGRQVTPGPVNVVARLSAAVSTWIDRTGALRLAAVAALVIAGLVVLLWRVRGRRIVSEPEASARSRVGVGS